MGMQTGTICEETDSRLKTLLLAGFCALLLAMSWVSPASAIIVPTTNPNLTDGKITIGLREELGKNAPEIERILRKNPHVRVGWPSEYEVSADPESPENFYLIDMEFYGASETYRRWDQGPYTDQRDTRTPIFVGRLDDGSFATDLDAEVRKIMRRKALLSIENMPAFRNGATLDIRYKPSSENPKPERFLSLLTEFPLSLKVEVLEGNAKPQFVYVLMIKPDNELQWVFETASDDPIKSGQSVYVDYGEKGFSFDAPGRHEFLTISSDDPINPEFFASARTGKIDPNDCSSLLKKILCGTITGIYDPTLPKVIRVGTDSGWSITRSRYYGSRPPVEAVGGGEIVGDGFAPWQVQIYSNQTYTASQIAADKKLGSKGKLLWKQKPFQRYHRCGGTLIAQNIVLTAAHCVAKGPTAGQKVLKVREVRVGTQNLERGGEKYRIVSVVVHAGYRPGNPKDDIALVRITPKSKRVPQKPILLTGNVRGFRSTGAGDRVQILGWGYTGVIKRGVRGNDRLVAEDGSRQVNEAKLRIAELAILGSSECRGRKGYRNVVVKKLCAETPKTSEKRKTAFSCTNDSGGPVIRWHGRKKVQVGIIVWGIGCGDIENGKQNPSLFVDLAQYTNWIITAKRRISQLEGDVVTHR
ncbi:S1 family peptidase [Parasphingorhabdus sp.]|uniref:S1 family peptidase n=1 Tax=Parasphingorhabdus sp. TaxID=2709688 RepID=UPI003BAF4EE3